MGAGDVSLRCVSVLVDELVRGGMQHACVSPGSRSTPLALALARRLDVEVHVHLDERASAFFALGIAKATGRPVAIACTSGTAAANFFPAVVEASQARVPLVVLTADRPPRLRGTGANQTIDQTDLYGRYVRLFVDAPVPAENADAATWREIGHRAVSAALDTPPGPVHVNLPFEEPLMPEDVSISTRSVVSMARATHSGPVRRADLDRADRELATERGAILIGSMPEPPMSVLALGHHLGWPIFAEPISRARVPGVLTAGQASLSSDAFMRAMSPDVVLQVGATPTTRASQRLALGAKRLVVVDDHHPEPDPEGRSWRLEIDPEVFATALVDRFEPRPTNAWAEGWFLADGLARRTIDELYDAWEEPYEGRVARDLAAAIPDGATLVVGSSMPIRDLDYAMAPRDGLRVLANRGASGIDGFVSTVLGVAASGAPTYALCGDLTLLHDAGSLLWSARRGLDAVFVVPNNDGGGVFSFLPQHELPEHGYLFTTPHRLDIGALCAAAGAGHTQITGADELIPAVERAAAAGGVHVVEVPSDRERNVDRHAEVQAAVDAALA
ncbi:MAG: 2-succinyl-5-enolpyruvyl-6-hydroxy-3-cyclohexene-1-carboxylic-acid synthase [Actinomycetota bacterium]